jgi:hypothetical protein
MQKLKGSGTTFSTSGKHWQPFHFNPRLAAKKARLHRLKAAGLTPPTDKASMRQAGEQAVAEHPEIVAKSRKQRGNVG